MGDLERLLEGHAGARTRLIATDGVFSMDGDVAPLRGHLRPGRPVRRALVMVDDSHATGFFGPTGRGTPEHCGVAGRVDIDHLDPRQGARRRQRRLHRGPARDRRAPAPALAAVPVLEHAAAPALVARPRLPGAPALSESTERRDRLEPTPAGSAAAMTEAGFALRPGEHPIVPIMLGDARLARRMAADLFDEGIYVVGFSFTRWCRGTRRADPRADQRRARAGAPRARRGRVRQGGSGPRG